MKPTASLLLTRLLTRARLRHLQVFMRVAELGSFKRAAEEVGLTQPAITHVVTDLESLLEAELFRRHARGVTPTALAQTLLPVVRRILATLAEGAETVASQLADAEGVVRLTATSSALNGLLVRLVPAFAQREPRIQLLVSQAEGDRYGGQVARGEVDAVACREPAVLPEGWRFHPLLEDAMVVVCGAAHPWAGRSRVAVAELAQEVWVVSPAETLARVALDQLAQERGWTLRLAPVVTRALPMTWALLQQPRAVALVPAGVVRQLADAGQVVVLPLDRQWPIGPLGLLMPTELPGDACRRLLAFAQQDTGWRGPGWQG